MNFEQINRSTRFTIEEEPQSVFYKDCNRYDGAINAYKVKNKHKDNMLEPVIFGRTNKINPIKK